MKKQHTFELSGGDDGAYGPSFGPVSADKVGEIESKGVRYLMLHLHTPIRYKNDRIEYVVVSPRYTGDTVKKLKIKGCTVGIGRVLPGQEDHVKAYGITTATVEYWSIGNCIPKI